MSSQEKSLGRRLSQIGKGRGKGMFAPESLKRLLIILAVMAIATTVELWVLNLLFN